MAENKNVNNENEELDQVVLTLEDESELGTLIALCIEGKQLSSEAFSELLDEQDYDEMFGDDEEE